MHRLLTWVALWIGSQATAAQLQVEFSAAPTSGSLPVEVQFEATVSGGTPLVWLWSFGDGTQGAGAQPTHVYAVPGVYTVSLQVFASTGVTSVSHPDLITVWPLEFTAQPTSGSLPLTVDFCLPQAVTPALMEWDFGDGSSAISSAFCVSHVYDEPGLYDVSVTHAASGAQALQLGLVQVEPFDGQVGFEVDAPSGPAPHAVTFLNTTESATPVDAWLWDLGDGSTSEVEHPAHTYVEPGTYAVTLVAAFGPVVLTAEQVVEVLPGEVAADFVASPVHGDAPLEVGFSDTSVGGVDAWLWDFGDGMTSTRPDPVHLYAEAGQYDVSLTVWGGADAVATTRRADAVTVEHRLEFLPPQLVLWGDVPAGLWLHDVTGDGRDDLLTLHADPAWLGVHVAADGVLEPPVVTSLPGPGTLLGLSDMDVDGHQDVVVLYDGLDRIAVLRGDGQGRFSPGTEVPIDLSARQFRHARLGDIDGDGDADVVAKRSDTDLVELQVFVNQGPGAELTARRSQAHRTEPALSHVDHQLELLDPGDGTLDVVLWRPTFIAFGPVSGSWVDLWRWDVTDETSLVEASPWWHQVGSSPFPYLDHRAAVIDVDRDGSQDLVLTHDHFLFSLAGPTLDGPALTPLSSSSSPPLAAADFGRTGRPELVVMDPGVSSQGLGLTNDLGLLTTQPWLPLGGRPPVAVGDVDGDGRTDVVGTAEDGSGALLWLNVTSWVAAWHDVGGGLPGSVGVPRLGGTGEPLPGAPAGLRLIDGPPATLAWLVVGTAAAEQPFLGGVLVPGPLPLLSLHATDATGRLTLADRWPTEAPVGLALWFQFWLADPGGPQGWAASNGLLARAGTP